MPESPSFVSPKYSRLYGDLPSASGFNSHAATMVSTILQTGEKLLAEIWTTAALSAFEVVLHCSPLMLPHSPMPFVWSTSMSNVLLCMMTVTALLEKSRD